MVILEDHQGLPNPRNVRAGMPHIPKNPEENPYFSRFSGQLFIQKNQDPQDLFRIFSIPFQDPPDSQDAYVASLRERH